MEPSGWWWLSYAGEESFNGAVVIEAEDFLSACIIASSRSLNPGGQVAGVPIPTAALVRILESDRNRLLSKGDCLRYGPAMEIS